MALFCANVIIIFSLCFLLNIYGKTAPRESLPSVLILRSHSRFVARHLSVDVDVIKTLRDFEESSWSCICKAPSLSLMCDSVWWCKPFVTKPRGYETSVVHSQSLTQSQWVKSLWSAWVCDSLSGAAAWRKRGDAPSRSQAPDPPGEKSLVSGKGFDCFSAWNHSKHRGFAEDAAWTSSSAVASCLRGRGVEPSSESIFFSSF